MVNQHVKLWFEKGMARIRSADTEALYFWILLIVYWVSIWALYLSLRQMQEFVPADIPVARGVYWMALCSIAYLNRLIIRAGKPSRLPLTAILVLLVSVVGAVTVYSGLDMFAARALGLLGEGALPVAYYNFLIERFETFRAASAILLRTSLNIAWIQLVFALLYAGGMIQIRLQREREAKAEAEIKAVSAQLGMLRFQLNPHFLFNTLNAISNLVLEKRNESADEMLVRLSEFLRGTLQGESSDMVDLVRELETGKLYLELEKVRFEDRLTVNLDVSPEAKLAQLPGLITQPLLENAIKHGIATSVSGGAIDIRARLDGDVLILEVENTRNPTRSPEAIQRVRSCGVGLQNIRERLRLLLGPKAQLEIEENEPDRFLARLLIPGQTAALTGTQET